MHPTSTARSRSGGIVVSTTERGLPVDLRIEESELQKPPRALAEEILGLCRLAAIRAQAARRRELTAAHVDPIVLRDMDLASDDDLARAEEAALTGDDSLPTSWLRSI